MLSGKPNLHRLVVAGRVEPDFAQDHRDRPMVLPWPDPVHHSPGRAAPTPDSTATVKPAVVDSLPPSPPPPAPAGRLAVTAGPGNRVRLTGRASGPQADLRP